MSKKLESRKVKFVSRREFLRLSGLSAGAVILAACGPRQTEDEPQESTQEPNTDVAVPEPETITLQFITPGTNNASEALYKPLSDSLQEERPDITVQWLGVPNDQGWGAYFERLFVLVAGGQQLDMAAIPSEGTRLTAARDFITPLDEFIDATPELDEYFEDVSQKLVDIFVYGGKTYALPYDFNNMVIWFNTKRLEEEGLELPPEDWTFEDFREYAMKLTKTEGDLTTHWGFDFWFSSFGLCPWLFNNGIDGMIAGDAQDMPLMNDPGFVEVIQFLKDLMYVDGSVPIDAGGAISLEAGTMAMDMAGRWPLATYLANDFEDFDIQYWPQNMRRVTSVGCGAWPIMKESQYKEEAWTLYTWMLSKDSSTYLASQGANIPARRSVGYSAAVVDSQPNNGRLWYESIDRDDLPVLQNTAPPDFSEMEEISFRYLGQIFRDEISVQEGLDLYQGEIEDMISRRPAEWEEVFQTG